VTIKTTPKGLKDFQTCALLYDLRHAQKLPETILGRDLITERFENTIKSVMAFFLYKKQSGFTPSYSALLNRWQKLWFPEGSSVQDIINDKHESAYGNMASLTSKAASALLDFYNYFSDTSIIPIGISEEYFLPLGDVVVTDVFDLIYSKENNIYVVKWVFNYKTTHEYLYMMDFACMQYAYSKKSLASKKTVHYGYYDIISGSPEVKMLQHSREDVELIEHWTSELSSCTTYAPRRGLTYYCKKCPFDTPCSKWSNWNKGKE
jgi:hypothetical protein